ncbi:uncharacterized protein H6S33_002383 [Morchella sextelata]|uniref:uncharacterized protein n=1 Tax=Morchella sextelata TaxID=1174677 RepID=UPI001D04D8B6|nr:uncharacterized protein H6S33_002383 [Morchella sextelata]KAH0607349.1 hypothetical protein H6S33_002383 [Morchella sextelata]
MSDNTSDPAAPYGRTATGRIRKKPTKVQSSKTAPTLPAIPDQLSTFCPVPACARDFRYRKNPEKAVWQHLRYYSRRDEEGKIKEGGHTKAHYYYKEKAKPASGMSKKEREHANSAKWRAKNPEKAKSSSALGAIKVKAELQLRRSGDFSEEKLKELVDEMMRKWEEKN